MEDNQARANKNTFDKIPYRKTLSRNPACQPFAQPIFYATVSKVTRPPPYHSDPTYDHTPQKEPARPPPNTQHPLDMRPFMKRLMIIRRAAVPFMNRRLHTTAEWRAEAHPARSPAPQERSCQYGNCPEEHPTSHKKSRGVRHSNPCQTSTETGPSVWQ